MVHDAEQDLKLSQLQATQVSLATTLEYLARTTSQVSETQKRIVEVQAARDRREARNTLLLEMLAKNAGLPEPAADSH